MTTTPVIQFKNFKIEFYFRWKWISLANQRTNVATNNVCPAHKYKSPIVTSISAGEWQVASGDSFIISLSFFLYFLEHWALGRRSAQRVMSCSKMEFVERSMSSVHTTDVFRSISIASLRLLPKNQFPFQYFIKRLGTFGLLWFLVRSGTKKWSITWDPFACDWQYGFWTCLHPDRITNTVSWEHTARTKNHFSFWTFSCVASNGS